jgi:chromosome segregation ATPase
MTEIDKNQTSDVNKETTPTSTNPNPVPTAAITPTNTGTDSKLVPEKDLIAVKRGAEEKIKQYETQISQWEDKYKQDISAKTDELLKANAAVSQLEKKISESSSFGSELEKVKTELAAAQESRKGLETKLMADRTKALTSLGVPSEKMEGKTLDQLDLMLDALSSAGRTANQPSKYDKAGGSGFYELTAIERAKKQLEHATIVGRVSANGSEG